jgi:hypothetical protein
MYVCITPIPVTVVKVTYSALDTELFQQQLESVASVGGVHEEDGLAADQSQSKQRKHHQVLVVLPHRQVPLSQVSTFAICMYVCMNV